MDFTKLENIIFTAVAGALALFLFIMAFYVISKGRRKTSGLDIFLRIVASLVLIVTAALFVLAIFTELTGSFRIAAAGDQAYFIVGDSVTKLPLGVIFVTLTTTTGQTIVIALFVIAFMTLVGDCLLAKKKYGKKPQKVKKSPEELKREAELAKIRKLSDAAVKKSNSAANAADKTSAADGDNAKDEKLEDEKKEEEQKPEEPEEDFDWRVDAQPKKSNNEFVGISDTADNDFDSFDSFDEAPDEQEEPTENSPEEHADFDGFDSFDETEETVVEEEAVESEETIESEEAEAFDDGAQEEPDGHVDERPWYEQDDPADERIIAEALADNNDGKPSFAADDYDETVETTETTTVYETTETTETVIEQSELDDVEESQDEFAQADSEYAEDEKEEKSERAWYEEGNVDSTDELESVVSEKTEVKTETESSYSDYHAASGSYGETSHEIEPDRDIYIPGIRVVNREPREEQKPAEKKKTPAARPAARPASRPAAKPTISTARNPATRNPAAKRPTAKRSATVKPAEKPAAKKPVAKRPATKRSEEKKPIVTATSDPSKLPVTRRYVILDRTNAVNIFSNYLKEREKSEKDKLESSINTIIIK